MASTAMTVGIVDSRRMDLEKECWECYWKRMGAASRAPRVGLTALFDFHHFAAFVMAAFSAGSMRELALVAIRAFRKRGAREVVVCAAGSGAALGMASFWIRHGSLPYC